MDCTERKRILRIFLITLSINFRKIVRLQIPKMVMCTLYSNYGIVITGINDPNQETVPVLVDTDVNYENPEIKEGSNTRPASMTITLTITVSNLTPNEKYNLFRYNSLTSVPDSGFNAKAANAFERWVLQLTTTTTYQMTKKIQSDEVAVFRCVKA
jgi:hypothetical protein